MGTKENSTTFIWTPHTTFPEIFALKIWSTCPELSTTIDIYILVIRIDLVVVQSIIWTEADNTSNVKFLTSLVPQYVVNIVWVTWYWIFRSLWQCWSWHSYVGHYPLWYKTNTWCFHCSICNINITAITEGGRLEITTLLSISQYISYYSYNTVYFYEMTNGWKVNLSKIVTDWLCWLQMHLLGLKKNITWILINSSLKSQHLIWKTMYLNFNSVMEQILDL